MRATVGVNVAVIVASLYVTTPATGVTPCFTVNVVVLIVVESIAWLNVTVSALVTGTAVALSAGLMDETVGAISDSNSTTRFPHANMLVTSRNAKAILRRVIQHLRNPK